MKIIQKVLIMILLVAVPVIMTAQDKAKTTGTVKYTTSISCEFCVNKVTTGLSQEKGIKEVKCDLVTKEVAVTYQKELKTPEEIKKSIEKLGYTAKEITAVNTPKK